MRGSGLGSTLKLTVAVVTVTWAAPVAPVAGAAPQLGLDGWSAVSGEGVTVVTEGRPEVAREIVRSLERVGVALADLLPEGGGGERRPTTLVLFSSPESYRPFRRHRRSGQFLPTPFENLILVDGADSDRPPGLIAAHESVHAEIRERELGLPLWLHEGLAEYYSTLRARGGGLVLGVPPPRHRSRLRGRAFVDFERLLRLSPSAGAYLEHEEAARFYAQSWLLAHRLLSDPATGARLRAALAALPGDGAALGEVVALDPLTGADELRRYLNRDPLPALFLPRRPAHAAVAVRRLEPAAVALLLAEVVIEQSRWEPGGSRAALAESLLEAASRRSPDSGDVVATRAYAAEVAGRFGEADRLYRRALYLDALSARSHARYARFLIEGRGGGEDVDELAAARLALARALEMSPGHPELARLEAELGAW